MTKAELIKSLSSECNLDINEAKTAVEIFFDRMVDILANGDRVEIRGLCSFYVKSYPGYIGRNPKTGETKAVKPKLLPRFKCGKELKERVNL